MTAHVSLVLESTPYTKILGRSESESGGEFPAEWHYRRSVHRQFCNLHEVAASVELLEIVESIPHSPFLSLFLSLSFSLLFVYDTQECRHPLAPHSHFSPPPPVIRALISGTRVGHRDVLRDKAIRGNFSDGQVS